MIVIYKFFFILFSELLRDNCEEKVDNKFKNINTRIFILIT